MRFGSPSLSISFRERFGVEVTRSFGIHARDLVRQTLALRSVRWRFLYKTTIDKMHWKADVTTGTGNNGIHTGQFGLSPSFFHLTSRMRHRYRRPAWAQGR